MPRNSGSLVEECTNGTTKASLYLSRLGLQKSLKDPTKPGRPVFKSVPVIHCFWKATLLEVKAIATRYKSRNAIREALRRRCICLDDIAKNCLESFGHQIWNNGVKSPFVTSVDATTDPSKSFKAEDTSKFKKLPNINAHTKSVEDTYQRHLIYEDPSDQRKYGILHARFLQTVKVDIIQIRIRLQVSAWIIQRACRKAEDDRREGKTPHKAYVKTSTTPAGFIAAVRVDRDRRTRSTTLSSNDMIDELCLDYAANSSVGSKRVVHSENARRVQPRSSRQAHSVLHTLARQRNNQNVAVILSPREPKSTKATEKESRKRKRRESISDSKTVGTSALGKREEMSKGTPPLPNRCRATLRRTKTRTGDERPAKFGADESLESLEFQLVHDLDDLGIELQDLLSPHNPGCHDLADIIRITKPIDTIALNDTERLWNVLGNAHDKQKTALNRWLGFVKTLAEFREITGLEGEEDTIEANFKSLRPDLKKKARAHQRRRKEILD